MGADHVDLDDLVAADAAVELAGVRPRTFESWIRSGKVTVYGLSEAGERLYWAREVLATEASTRCATRGRPRSGLTAGTI